MNGTDGLPSWVKVVATVGFPIAVSGWLLYRADLAVATSAVAAIQMSQHREETATHTRLLRAICRYTARQARQDEAPCDL